MVAKKIKNDLKESKTYLTKLSKNRLDFRIPICVVSIKFVSLQPL